MDDSEIQKLAHEMNRGDLDHNIKGNNNHYYDDHLNTELTSVKPPKNPNTSSFNQQ